MPPLPTRVNELRRSRGEAGQRAAAPAGRICSADLSSRRGRGLPLTRQGLRLPADCARISGGWPRSGAAVGARPAGFVSGACAAQIHSSAADAVDAAQAAVAAAGHRRSGAARRAPPALAALADGAGADVDRIAGLASRHAGPAQAGEAPLASASPRGAGAAELPTRVVRLAVGAVTDRYTLGALSLPVGVGRAGALGPQRAGSALTRLAAGRADAGRPRRVALSLGSGGLLLGAGRLLPLGPSPLLVQAALETLRLAPTASKREPQRNEEQDERTGSHDPRVTAAPRSSKSPAHGPIRSRMATRRTPLEAAIEPRPEATRPRDPGSSRPPRASARSCTASMRRSAERIVAPAVRPCDRCAFPRGPGGPREVARRLAHARGRSGPRRLPR